MLARQLLRITWFHRGYCMNANLLMIDNMLAGIAGAAPASSKPNRTREAAQLSPGSDDKSPQVGAPETTQTDNTAIAVQEQSAKKPAQDFDDTLRKTVATETPPKTQSETKPEEKEPAQPLLTQEPPILSILPILPTKKAAARILVKPETTGEPGHLTTAKQAQKPAAVPAKSLGGAAATAWPGKLTPQALKAGTKPGVPELLKRPPTVDSPPKVSKDPGKTPIPNKTVVDAKHPATRGISQELINASVGGGGKTTAAIAGGKQIIAGTSATGDRPEATALSGKITATSEKAPAVSAGIPAVEAKSPKTNSQSVGSGPEKPVQTAARPTDSKAAVPDIISESWGGNDKKSLHAWNRISDNAGIQKLNATQVQISNGQTRNRGSSTSNNTNSNPEQILTPNGAQAPASEQSPHLAENAKPANPSGQTSPSDVSEDIGKQILESIHSSLSRQSGDRQITVRLNPPELGRVFIRFREQDAQVIGLLEVSRTQTRLEIEQALPQIIRNLADCGIQMKRLEVVLSDGEQSGQEGFKDQLLQNGGTEQQNTAYPGPNGNDPDADGISEWSADYNGYRRISELQEESAPDGSINVLI